MFWGGPKLVRGNRRRPPGAIQTAIFRDGPLVGLMRAVLSAFPMQPQSRRDAETDAETRHRAKNAKCAKNAKKLDL